MADETALCDTFIYSTLAGDNTLNTLLATPPTSLGSRKSIYFDKVPQDVEQGSLPVVIVRHPPPREDDDALGNAGLRLLTSIRLEIVANAIAENYSSTSAAASRIDALLHLASSSAGKILKAERKAPIRNTYYDGSREFREVGGLYLVQVSEYV